MTFEHPALPPAVSRPWVGAAAMTMVTGVAVSWSTSALIGVALFVFVIAVRGHQVIAATVTAAGALSLVATIPLSPLPEGHLDGDGVMVTDVVAGRYGPYALIEMDEGPILADLPPGVEALRGERVHIEGMVKGDPDRLRGRRHRGAVQVGQFAVVASPSSPVDILGNSIRERVKTRLAPLEGGRALLAGFLVGDTDGVDEIDQEAMRRAGLSHFTAVSGSNVALFLGLLFVVAGPIGVGPRRRAVVGLLGLPVFAAATRFEPSVLRASVMAAIGLGGRLVGLTMEAWQLLATAVIGLILLDPGLATSVGFQLSVAATAGVLVGARWPGSRARVSRALAVTVGAQVAVAPVLVLHFGAMPLLSPLANLVAGPVVALSTVLGAIGVIGPAVFAAVGSWLAAGVLLLANVAAGWPQVGWPGLIAVLVVVFSFRRLRRFRGQLALAVAAVIVFLVLGGGELPPEPGVVVFDVGQGDSILLSGGDGRFALVDGGPDPVVLVEALRRYGVRSLELVVLSHVHADHATGLSGLVGRVPIGQVWASPEPHRSNASSELLGALGEVGVVVESPVVGDTWRLGELVVTVEGPLRRYASPNDQSIVLMVEGPGRSMLLSGDVETVAQAELGHLRADVLKVPHQGAATSDPGWLDAMGSDLAVISVGPNEYGHPADWVVARLQASGATVLRTDRQGDVVVPLS